MLLLESMREQTEGELSANAFLHESFMSVSICVCVCVFMAPSLDITTAPAPAINETKATGAMITEFYREPPLLLCLHSHEGKHSSQMYCTDSV